MHIPQLSPPPPPHTHTQKTIIVVYLNSFWVLCAPESWSEYLIKNNDDFSSYPSTSHRLKGNQDCLTSKLAIHANTQNVAYFLFCITVTSFAINIYYSCPFVLQYAYLIRSSICSIQLASRLI